MTVMSRLQVKVADEVWIATALLQRENPKKVSFSIEEIVNQALSGQECMFTRSSIASLTDLQTLVDIACSSRRLLGGGDCIATATPTIPRARGQRSRPRRTNCLIATVVLSTGMKIGREARHGRLLSQTHFSRLLAVAAIYGNRNIPMTT